MTEQQPAGPQLVAPFRQLIHGIHQFGKHWSWRCGIAKSQLDPGYVDGACRYDHNVDSWEQLVTDATEHLRHWHDIRPTTSPETTAGLLRALAAGRRDYANLLDPADAREGPIRDRFLAEAASVEQAARVAAGDFGPLYDLLPTWRWTKEMDERARNSTTNATVLADVQALVASPEETPDHA